MSEEQAKKSAVVLLSGGLDSTTTVAIAQSDGYELNAITFRYGQRHEVELNAARAVASHYGIENHVICNIDLRTFGGSALTSDVAVPKSESVDDLGDEIPVTYVPARHTIFLSFALAFAETIPSSDIFIGVNALAYSGYPDCRPEYIAAYEAMANLATRASVTGRPVKIHTPLIDLTKAQIVKRGLDLDVDYGLTTSCYDPNPDGVSCGNCDACLLRRRGFAENEIADPIAYQ